jgi:catechol 2,3-dioxygenase-like lactoylglutathione lyase family enzyme
MSRIGHIILSVSDWEVSSSFYNALLPTLGFTIEHEIGGEWGKGRAYKCADGSSIWIQHNADAKYETFVRNPGLDHLCLRVDTREQVDQAHELVQSLLADLPEHTSGRVTIPPKEFPEYTPNYYAFNFRDPDGLPLEVATY